jgi:hypothetical protein
MSNERIFVMIAAYKDLEINATLYDLYNKADFPENIRVSVCWQGDFDEVRQYKNWPHVYVSYVEPDESKGLGFARSIAQAQYDGEEYCLQLDAHHRFAKSWDTWHITETKKLQKRGFKKPVLTAYAGSYSSTTNALLETVPSKIVLDPHIQGFRPGWWTIPFFPNFLPSGLTEPVKARFCSGHYIFTVGEFCDEFRYDPFCYFWGEELSISVRLYTMGYDLFHPHVLQVWHRYVWSGKDGNPGSGGEFVEKQYDVFKDKARRESYWMGRLRKMTQQTPVEGDKQISLPACFGLGTKRKLSQYEEYAGINFKQRTVDVNW